MNAIRLITVQCFPSNGFLWVFLLYTLFKLSAPAFSSQLKVRLDFLSVVGVTILHSFTAWSACVCSVGGGPAEGRAGGDEPSHRGPSSSGGAQRSGQSGGLGRDRSDREGRSGGRRPRGLLH